MLRVPKAVVWPGAVSPNVKMKDEVSKIKNIFAF